MSKQLQEQTKYFAYQLDVRNGEYEYQCSNFLKATSMQEAEKQHEVAASEFYGNGKKEGNGYYFNGGEVFVEPGLIWEISRKTYYEMTRYYDLLAEKEAA